MMHMSCSLSDIPFFVFFIFDNYLQKTNLYISHISINNCFDWAFIFTLFYVNLFNWFVSGSFVFTFNTIFSLIRLKLFTQLDDPMPMTASEKARQNQKIRMKLNKLKKSRSKLIQIKKSQIKQMYWWSSSTRHRF